MSLTGNPPPLLLSTKIRPLLITAIVGFIILEVVALSPSPLEEPPGPTMISPENLIQNLPGEETLAPGIPKEKVPEYTVEKFHYVSSKAGQKQWMIDASRANLFHKIKLVHARTVTAYLYDPDGKTTVVTGKEAKYFMDEKDLEMFGSVHTKFPDGFETTSEYLRYHPDTRKIEIPTSYAVDGSGHEENGQDIEFQSRGLKFEMGYSEIYLPEAVHFTMIRRGPKNTTTQGVPEKTTIDSDHCTIYRAKQTAHFTMDPGRSLDSRFVLINQPTLFVRGRRADLNYGDFSQVLQYLTAYDDVLVKEKSSGPDTNLRYGTGGRADFDTHRDIIVLTEYPQVYQDHDTVTGDIITMHRDTDIIEVEHSNAFSTGQQQQQQQQPKAQSQPSASGN